MKTRHIITITLLFSLLTLATSEVVVYQLTGNHLFSQSADLQKNDIPKPIRCTDKPTPARPKTQDVQLKALPEYEQACGSAFVDSMMLFTDMPISTPDAEAAADKMAVRLKKFNTQKVSPIVIMEPDSEWGLVDFHEYAQGYYDEWITAYFKQLKRAGIDDSKMGLWIPFPEPQQPFWNNSTPDDFALSANRYFEAMRSVFPKAKTGILLDSQAGEDRQELQLLSYTRLINNSLVDVAGLQGFPWDPTEDNDFRTPLSSASEFIPASVLDEVAKSLGTKEVLINTGTYRHRKTENGGNLAIPIDKRHSELTSITHEVSLLREMGYSTTINIFTQNKLDTKEGTDWSYWQSGKYTTSQQTPLFTNFVHALASSGSKISLFDAKD